MGVSNFVFPAKAGTPLLCLAALQVSGAPAFAGVTGN